MTKIYAHRGLSRLYPENSLEAIKEASKYEYIYGIEFDVRMTKDKKFVVIHDKDITLVSNGTGIVNNMTLEELYKYDFTYNSLDIKKEYLKSFFIKNGKIVRKNLKNLMKKSNKICTLETVLMSVKNKKLLIEIKKDNDENFDLEKFYNVVKKYNLENIMIHSFNIEVIKNLKEKDSKLNLGILIGVFNMYEKLKMNTNFISIEHSILTEEILKEQLKRGKTVNIWTVNSHKEIKKLKKKFKNLFSKLNIITDNPYLIQKCLK